MEDRNEFERAKSLVLETAGVISKFKQDSEYVVRNIQSQLDSSLGEQRKMMVEMVREEITQEASRAVRHYVEDMEEARNQMVQQVREFNTYLNKVNEENKKLATRWMMIAMGTLMTLVVGGIALIFFFSKMVEQKRMDADMLGKINRADIVRCGDELCAKTGRVESSGYRVIKRR
ncbi:lytic enzyme [Neisseria sp. CCUG12390]|uniref:lytic enzyme n=1 Tax=Neisseria sp. CCUG12390 TaxID=3392035 RepID=UPI003A0FEA09